jgi:hypothetical protein
MFAKIGRLIRGSGTNPLQANQEGDVFVGQGHGKYHAAVMSGNVYVAMNQTGVVLTVGLATTYTGLVVSNPNTSSKVLSILAAGFNEVVAPVAIQAGFLGVGNSVTDVVHSVAALTYNMLVGSGNSSVAKADTGATLPTLVTPYYALPLTVGRTAGGLGAGAGPALTEIGGMIVLKPGSYAFIAGFSAGAAVGTYGCIVWEEIAI